MKIHDLEVAAKRNKKRLGRGIGSGQGKTAGRGTKGQNARSGGGVRLGFEGGQTQLAQRLPKKRGFKAINPTLWQVVNVGDLDAIKKTTINNAVLEFAGIIRDGKKLVKLLGSGEVKQKLTVSVQAASKSAIAKIEQSGGQVKLVKLTRSNAKTSTQAADKVKKRRANGTVKEQ